MQSSRIVLQANREKTVIEALSDVIDFLHVAGEAINCQCNEVGNPTKRFYVGLYWLLMDATTTLKAIESALEDGEEGQ